MPNTAIAHNISNYFTVTHCIADYGAVTYGSSDDVSVPDTIYLRATCPAHDQAN